MDESVFHAILQAGQLDKLKVRVFFTTPPFVDYVWVGRKQINPAIRDRFATAFLALKPGQDDKILAILRGEKFIKADDAEYDTRRHIATALKLF